MKNLIFFLARFCFSFFISCVGGFPSCFPSAAVGACESLPQMGRILFLGGPAYFFLLTFAADSVLRDSPLGRSGVSQRREFRSSKNQQDEN